MDRELEHIKGTDAHTALANDVSDAINRALKLGIPTDHVVCIVAAVATDYGRFEFGPDYCRVLAKVVEQRRDIPLPESK